MLGVVEQPNRCANVHCTFRKGGPIHLVKIGTVMLPVCEQCAVEVMTELEELAKEIKNVRG